MRRAGTLRAMMRDLLYLSENKMRALVPQLPGQLRRRLGFEAGLNVGVASARASLPGEPQPSSIALLDAVVEMIEQEKGSRWRTDPDLRAGDWVQFEEEFLYGDAASAGEALSGLVYFAATDGEAPFVLCGSSVHVLDRWHSGDGPPRRVGHFYMDALLDYARALAGLPDEAAVTEFTSARTLIGIQQDLLDADDGGGAVDLAAGDQAGDLGEGDPADGFGLVRIRRADRIGPAGQVQLEGAVGGTRHRLERQQVLDAA